jgi:hypothetical protein
MIEIRDGRLWFYDTTPDSVYPTLDFELLAGYICPECKSTILAYCVGRLPKNLITHYHERDSNSNRQFEVINHHHGGFILEQVNHGRGTYTQNCKYDRLGRGCGVYQIILSILGLGSLHSTTKLKEFISAIEQGKYAERGIITVEDVCGKDEPLALFDKRVLLPGVHYEFEARLTEKLNEFIEAYQEVETAASVKPVEVETSKIGRKVIVLSKAQTALF